MRKSIRYYVLGIMLFVATFVFLYLMLDTQYLIPRVLAEDSSPSSILKQIQAEAASMAAQIKTEVSQTLDNRIYSGFVLTKTDTKLTLEASGSAQIVLTNKYTDLSDAPKIALKDFVVALGDIDDNSELVAKKIVKMAPPSDSSPSAVFGRVKDIGPMEIVVLNKNNKEVKISVDQKTNYQLAREDAQFSDILTGHFIIALGNMSENGDLSARFVYLVPSAGELTPPSKTASPSASSSTQPKH